MFNINDVTLEYSTSNNGVIINIIIIKLPYLYIKFKNLLLSLNIDFKMLKPSSGYIGNKLNINKAIFIIIEYCKKKYIKYINEFESEPTFKNIVYNPLNAKAKIILVNTPEMLTKNKSRLCFLKFIGLISTGFAQPKPTSKKVIIPKASKCFIGLSVNLPKAFGVGSPSLYAVYACANSCNEKAKSKANIYPKKSAKICDAVKLLPCNV